MGHRLLKSYINQIQDEVGENYFYLLNSIFEYAETHNDISANIELVKPKLNRIILQKSICLPYNMGCCGNAIINNQNCVTELEKINAKKELNNFLQKLKQQISENE